MNLLTYSKKLEYAISTIVPNVKKIYSNNELLVYKKEWDTYSYIDIIGFSAIMPSNRTAWQDAEAAFLEIVSENSSKYIAVEPTLAFLYEPALYIQLLQDIILIERNEMHCRKYTIPITDNLSEQVMRLPIASLRGTQIGNLLPKSARKTMRSIGLGVQCIDAIERGNVDKVLQSLPQSLSSLSDNRFEIEYPGNEEDLLNEKTRLLELSIEGFRAYGKKEVFDLDADLVVIAGANGLGKTSFFDALDFVSTGSVRRFNKRVDNLPNLFCGDKLDISLKFNVEKNINGTKVYQKCVINRNSVEANRVTFNGRSSTRKDVIQGLTQTTLKENLDKLIPLFRASHLISQSQAELTENLRIDSSIPADVVGRMLSLEDYVQYISKIDRTIEHTNRLIKEKEKDLERISSEKKAIDNKLKEVREPVQEQLGYLSCKDKYIDDILNRVSNLGITIEYKKNDTSPMLQNLRGKIEALIAQEQDVIGRLNNLHDQYKHSLILKKELEEIRPKAIAEKNTYNKVLSEFNSLRQSIESLSNQREISKQKLYSCQLKSQNFRWYLQNKKKLDKKNQMISNLKQLIDETNIQIKKLSVSLTEAHKQSITKADELESVSIKRNKLINNLTTLNYINERVGWYMEANKRLSKLKVDLAKTSEENENCRKRIKRLNLQLSNYQANFDKLGAEYQTQRKLYDEYRTLLGEIRRFIKGAQCPLCGQEHQDNEVLLRKIECRLGEQPSVLIEYHSEVKLAQANVNLYQGLIIEEERTLVILKEREKNKKADAEALYNEVKDFEIRCEEAGVPSESVNFALCTQIEIIQDDLNTVEKYKELLEAALSEQQGIERKVKKSLLEAQSKISGLQHVVESSQSQINAFLNEAISRGISPKLTMSESDYESASIERKLERLRKEDEKLTSTLETSSKRFNEISIEVQKQRQLMENIEANLNVVELQLKKVKRQMSVLQDEKFNFAYHEEHNMHVLERIRNLNSVREEVLAAEVAVSSSERSASMTILTDQYFELEGQVDSIRLQKDELEKRLNLLRTTKSYLDKVHNSSLSGFFDAIGPIATVIQQKLRPAYCFDRMTIKPDAGQNMAVKVQLTDPSKLLAPADYFSESQIGILALSLFFSVVFTQKWSGLRAIMLDDPVVHFDDLNVYAFADLLRSWIVTSPEKNRPQFIISTCDDRLLRILRRKFEPLTQNGRAKFYVFKSYGQDGPVILHPTK